MACSNNDSGGEKKKERIRNSNMKQKQIKMNMNNIFNIIRFRYTIGYSRKNPNRGRRLRIYFSEKNPGIFIFVTLPLEILENTSFHPWKFCKIV